MHPGRLESQLDHGLGVALAGLRLVLLGALLGGPFVHSTIAGRLARVLEPPRRGSLERAECGRPVSAHLVLFHLDGARPAGSSCGRRDAMVAR
jgi:hypothetical protein